MGEEGGPLKKTYVAPWLRYNSYLGDGRQTVRKLGPRAVDKPKSDANLHDDLADLPALLYTPHIPQCTIIHSIQSSSAPARPVAFSRPG